MWQGHARSRGAGDTLIVDTIGFRGQRRQRNPFTRFDQNLHVAERFSMTASDTLWYEFTVTDPTVFSRPWSGAFSMRKANEALFEFGCHEGNYALANMLRGARVHEKIEPRVQW